MRYDLGGTCIDFVLFYAATLLRSGCAPLVLILGEEHGYGHRHALVGLWRSGRRPRHAAVVLGPGAFRSAWRDGACFAVESTWAARDRPFPAALEEAGRALADLRLLWAIDVTAAREAKIGSLPGRPSQTVLGGWEPRITDQPTKTMTERARELLGGLAVEVVASKTPSDAGKRWEIRGFRCRIGHGVQHEVDLDEITVSNPHAVLAVEEERILLIDLQSKNGTRVAGERLAPHVPRLLEPGDEFEVGGVTLRLVRGSAGGAGGRSS
jgi:hypothetical protein